MPFKERIYKKHIDRESCGAGHEGHHEHGEYTVFGILDVPRSHDGRHVTTEAHEHRYKTTSVQTDAVHDRIHDKRLTGHVSGVLHERDKEEENDDVRQEREHSPYSFENTIDKETAEPSFCHAVMAYFA